MTSDECSSTYTISLWLHGLVWYFGINSICNAGWKVEIALGFAWCYFTLCYFSFPACMLLIPNTTPNHGINRSSSSTWDSNMAMHLALVTHYHLGASQDLLSLCLLLHWYWHLSTSYRFYVCWMVSLARFLHFHVETNHSQCSYRF